VKILCWDTEALHNQDKSEKWDAWRARAGISVATTLDYDTFIPKFYSDGDENFGPEMGEYSFYALAQDLEAADVVVSYNGQGYDNHVLTHLLGRYPIFQRDIDLYAEIKYALGNVRWGKGAWKLERVATDTLGIGKTAESGAHAAHLYRNRRYGELFTYNFMDVWLVRELLAFIRANGYVLNPDGTKLHITLPL
jgi:hypothetical protein